MRDAPARARAFVRQELPDLAPAVAYDVMILTSELVTNAVLHARTRIQVGVVHGDGDGRIMVAVGDHSHQGLPERLPGGPARASGRGLSILAATAQDWGVADAPDGKTVWFVLPGA